MLSAVQGDSGCKPKSYPSWDQPLKSVSDSEELGHVFITKTDTAAVFSFSIYQKNKKKKKPL